MKLIRNAAFLAAVLTSTVAAAQSIADGTIKIGVMNDMSGLYSDISGRGAVVAARMAVEDFGAAAKGLKVEIVCADHQNKPDIGASIARNWIDVDHVDVIVDVPTSSVALASRMSRVRRIKAVPDSGAAASDLTGRGLLAQHGALDLRHLCARQWYRKRHGKTGGDTWFFITADYAFGHALERDTGEVVEANGGKVLGAVRHPLNRHDFSSFLLQAQASKAKVIGLANAGGDTINSIKQAAEFGITQGGQKLAAF